MPERDVPLTAQQRRAWEAWAAVSSKLPTELHRRLYAEVGLSLTDVEVMTALSVTVDGRSRVNDLARALSWERSRLSHHIGRMQMRGLVDKEECPDDGRGAFVVLTKAGQAGIRRAAVVRDIALREVVFSTMSVTDLELFTAALEEIWAGLDPSQASPGV